MHWFLAAGLALYAGTCLADTAPRSWAQEPDSVFGIVLGKPFPGAGQVGDCPVFAPFRREPHSGELCVDPREAFTAERIPLQNLPLDGLANAATVLLAAGRVQSIVVPVERARYAAMKALLVERYGVPHAAGTPDDEKAGEVLSWKGSRTAIELRERDAGQERAVLEFNSAAASGP
jgi:hypothetical protein